MTFSSRVHLAVDFRLHCCHRRRHRQGLDRTIQVVHDVAASRPSLPSPSTAPTTPPPVVAAPATACYLRRLIIVVHLSP
ncbi:hypothetical protein ACLOJK_010535 [Asimina triloba]